MLLYPHLTLNFVKRVHPLRRSMVAGIRGGDVPILYSPFVEWSIILDRSKFSVFLLYEEEVCCIGAP